MKVIQVSVSDNVFDLVEKYTRIAGLSRSALCAVAIAEKLMAYEHAYKVLSDSFETALPDIVKLANSEPNSKGDISDV